MLPKKERLSRDVFNRFFSVGSRRHTKTLQLVFSPHDSFHASVVVSKKVARSAVVRNKIRRRIYDILRRHRETAGIQGVYIMVAKNGVTALTYEELRNEVIQLITAFKKTS